MAAEKPPLEICKGVNDFDKVVALRDARGSSAEQIEQLRRRPYALTGEVKFAQEEDIRLETTRARLSNVLKRHEELKERLSRDSDKMIFERLQKEFEAARAAQSEEISLDGEQWNDGLLATIRERVHMEADRKAISSQTSTPLDPPIHAKITYKIKNKKHARDDQFGRMGTLFSSQSNGQALGPVNLNMQPNKVKARGSLIVQASKKGFVHSGVDILKPGSDIIEILATDKLIHEVERVCGGENPEPALVQRAKLILKDHERALLEAIGKLADVSDGDDSPDRIQYMSQEPQSRAHVFPNNRSRSHCK